MFIALCNIVMAFIAWTMGSLYFQNKFDGEFVAAVVCAILLWCLQIQYYYQRTKKWEAKHRQNRPPIILAISSAVLFFLALAVRLHTSVLANFNGLDLVLVLLWLVVIFFTVRFTIITPEDIREPDLK